MQAVDRIHAHGRFSGKPGLHRMRALCDALGNPQNRLKFIHLAGTNGKGSTAAMLASVFQQAGYCTGLFTSPYLVVFHERIRVNGVMIPDDTLERLAARVEAAERTLALPAGEQIGEFEFVTALGFLYFVEQGCDIVILETGLGGAADATNVIPPPEVCVITPISLDHTAVLGKTTAEIAQTKIGIVKPHSAVVCAAVQPDDAMQVISSACPQVQIPAPALDGKADFSGVRFRWEGNAYHVPLVGAHQIENAKTALQTIKEACKRGWNISLDAIRQGLSSVKFSGRMEILSQSPRVIVDGCHNKAGVHAVAAFIREAVPASKLHLVVGMMRDKDVVACASVLGRLSNSIFVTRPQNERALSATELALHMPIKNAVRGVYDTPSNAFRAAKQAASSDDTVLVCGSLYLIGDAKKYFCT